MSSVKYSSEFGRLFGGSKIAQLPKRLADTKGDRNKPNPTHQIIQALDSAHARREFGLKMKIPRKISSKLLIVNDLDNKYRLPDFETKNGFYFKKQKFKEMGLVVSAKAPGTLKMDKDLSDPNYPANSNLFPDNKMRHFQASSISDVIQVPVQSLDHDTVSKAKEALKNLRVPFMKWLAEKHPEKFAFSNLNNEIIEFLTEYQNQGNKVSTATSKTDIPQPYKERYAGTAGLSYLTKGRLPNSPNGIKSGNVFGGRYIGERAGKAQFALGGFVASSGSPNAKFLTRLKDNVFVEGQKSPRELEVPLVTAAVDLNLASKKLHIEAYPVVKKQNASRAGSPYVSPILRQNIKRSSNMSMLDSLLGTLQKDK